MRVSGLLTMIGGSFVKATVTKGGMLINTSDSTASDRSDYTAAIGKLIFAPGETGPL